VPVYSRLLYDITQLSMCAPSGTNGQSQTLKNKRLLKKAVLALKSRGAEFPNRGTKLETI